MGEIMSRQEWEPPKVSYVGDIDQLVLMGGGKGSPSPKDPGEPRKVPGQDMGA